MLQTSPSQPYGVAKQVSSTTSSQEPVESSSTTQLRLKSNARGARPASAAREGAVQRRPAQSQHLVRRRAGEDAAEPLTLSEHAARRPHLAARGPLRCSRNRRSTRARESRTRCSHRGSKRRAGRPRASLSRRAGSGSSACEAPSAQRRAAIMVLPSLGVVCGPAQGPQLSSWRCAGA
jgi:hypothetical protein